jgi:DNA-binding NarL/FixJ family response regulator
MNAIAVALVASDPVTQEGAAARLTAYREVALLPPGQTHRAEVLVVLANAVTEDTMSAMEDAYRSSRRADISIVLVANEIKEHQIFRAVGYGLVSLLYRQESDFHQIVRAVVAARVGRAEVPGAALRYLLDQVKSIRHHQATHQLTITSLTMRELKVLQLLSDGLDTGEVASSMNYSERTVKNIIHGVVTRFKFRNRTHAVASAIRSGIL